MPTTRTRKPSTPRSPSRKLTPALPAALAKRAREQHTAKLTRLASVGRAAIARIHERQTDIAASVVDIGLAIAELKLDHMPEALGRENFAQVCALDLGMSEVTANGFIALATRVPREAVKSLGLDRARAVLELMDAAGEERPVDEVMRAPVKLPSGRTLDVQVSTAQEIKEAAKELRALRLEGAEKRSGGFTTTPAEKRSFRELMKRFEGHGGAGTTRLVATRGGRGAKVRFEVPLVDVAAFAEALRRASRG